MYGVAREVHAVTGAPLAPDPGDGGRGRPRARATPRDLLSVAVDDPELCPRFSVRVFTDVQIGPSPLWLKARLMAAGQRPINNVVDITNYVMLLLGQPMHAYDLDRVAGPALHVRRAREGERLTTLDGEQRVFDDDAVLVCDADGPTGIGGIMGGASSEVSEDTTRVAMEAATWNGPNILQTSKKLGLRTRGQRALREAAASASSRCAAQRLAARLMVELCGARMVPGTIDVAAPSPSPTAIVLRTARLEGLLGERIEPERVAAILARLGFGVEPRRRRPRGRGPLLPATTTCTREADLIEEVARIHGLDRLPATLPARREAVGGLSPAQKAAPHARGPAARTRPRARPSTSASSRRTRCAACASTRRRRAARVLPIANPLSEDQSAMRTTLLPGLLDAARHNVARDLERPAPVRDRPRLLLERAGRQPDERLHLGVVLAGDFVPATWRTRASAAGLLRGQGAARGTARGCSASTGAWSTAGRAFLHPGRAAEVAGRGARGRLPGRAAPAPSRPTSGWTGSITRRRCSSSISTSCCRSPSARSAAYEDLISYPAVFQDIAVVVDEAGRGADRAGLRARGGGPRPARRAVFDLYRGEQVGEGRKSLALRLEFRSDERTLTDDEVSGDPRADQGRSSRTRRAGRSVSEHGRRVARACVVAPRGLRARWRRRCSGRIRASRWRRVTARTDAGRRLDDLYPRHRVPLELEAFDAERLGAAADVALVSYPHGAAAPAVAELRDAGCASSTSLRTSGCTTRAAYERWYGPHGAPALLRRGCLRPHRAAPRRDRAGDAGREPRLLLDRRDPGARAAGARRADRGRGRRREERRVRRRP